MALPREAKIFLIMGKSSSGKDTLFRRLKENKKLGLTAIVPYTTRPPREDEKDGVDYFFTDEKGFGNLLAQGKVIEARAYDTCHGLWRYFTVLDGQFDFFSDARPRLMIGTLSSYLSVREYFGSDAVAPLLVELDDGVRLSRALSREREQATPRYEEMCRRFLADAQDFSEEKIAAAGIVERFNNGNLEECEARLVEYIANIDCAGQRN